MLRVTIHNASCGLLTPFVIGVVLLALRSVDAESKDSPIFESDVLPIFTKYCFNCHGKSSPQLALDLRTASSTMRGSQNGPVIVKGSLEDSLLWKKVSTREMPLALFSLKLTDGEIDTIRRWILAGAPAKESADLPNDVKAQFDYFEANVRPIFMEHCTACHGGDEPDGGLDLRTLKSLVMGGKNGPVVVEGFSEKSVLVRKVDNHDMPPAKAGRPLTSAEIGTITRWIDKGRFADYVDTGLNGKFDRKAEQPVVTEKQRAFWAFRKPVAPPLPNVRDHARIRSPIDRFILAKLESNDLGFSPDASKRELVRRAFFDLHGLPPSPEEARAFLADERPDAYERLLDRLLASPRYGERWGRHWLDVVGYLDTVGKDFDPKVLELSPGMWRYRDYVIQATNNDTPWNRFLVEQLAGDELTAWRTAEKYSPEILELLTATGFLKNVMDDTDEDISNLPFDRYETLFKLMERVSTSTLALTLACARCHNHKFDPIPQTDYYRFLSLFTPAYNPSKWLQPKNRFLHHVSKAEEAKVVARRNELQKEIAKLHEGIAALREPVKQRLQAAKIEKLPAAIREDTKSALATAAKDRSVIQKYLAEKLLKSLSVSDDELAPALSDEARKSIAIQQAKIQAKQSGLESLRLEKVQALWDVGKPPTIRVLQRGDVDFPGPIVEPGFLTVLTPPGQSAARPSSQKVGDTTGYRLAFAEWLTSGEHPLTARVIVNRLWQHHFGKGIVDTPGNFGASGSRPTHPELLDWLAVDFVEHGWGAKRIHRMIMTSTVYRQASSRAEQHPSTGHRPPNQRDPDNRLLWRMNLRRLDAEAIRDSVLAVSGPINYAMGGPPIMLKSESSGLQRVDSKNPSAAARRSIYLLSRRTYPLSFLGVFDYPIIDVNCTRRVPSATPLQSLTMMNSEFLANSASQLARRVEEIAGGADAPLAKKIDVAFWLVYSRSPGNNERNAATDHLQRLAKLYLAEKTPPAETARRSLESFVHMLQCSNEFLYVD